MEEVNDAAAAEDEGNAEGDNETPVIEPETTSGEESGESAEEISEAVSEEPVEEEPVSESAIGMMTAETMDVTDYKVTVSADAGYSVTFSSGVNTDDDNKLTGDDIVFTVTANPGYILKSVTWSAGGTDSAVPNGDTEGSYKITKETLATITDNINITVTAVQVFDVTVLVDTPANIATLASIVDSVETAIDSVAASNTVAVETGKTLSLKVVPAEGFEVTVTVGGDEKTGNNNVYDIGAITAATTVNITTKAVVNSYTVNETIKDNGTEKTGDDAAKLAKIAYTENCVTVNETTKAQSIAKGTDLTFKVDPVPDETDSTKNSFDGKAVEVSYRIGSGTEKPLTKDADGVYKVEKTEITDAVTIIVNVRPLKEVTVDFTGVDLNTAELEYKIADAATFTKLEAAAVVKITEGQTFSFKVKALDVFQIDEVSVQHGSTNDAVVLEKGEGDVYSFVATNVAPAISVKASYDKTKVNSLTFKLVGDKDSYTVNPTNITDTEETPAPISDLNDPADGTAFKADEVVLTKAGAIKVTLTPDISYEITKVVLGTETLYNKDEEADKEKNPAGPYTIDFGNTTEITAVAKELTVTTKAKTFEKDIKVSFTKGTNDTVVDYTVTTGETVVKDPKTDDTYTIKAGEGYLKFDVTTVGKYTPVVNVNDGEALENPEKKDGKYSYTYLVSKLNENGSNEIVVDAEIAQKDVTVVYTDTQVDVSATVGNKSMLAENKVYTVNDGDILSFKVTARENYQLDKVTKKGAAADAEAEEVTLTNGRFNLTVEEDTTITITANGVLSQKELLAKTADGTVAVAKDKTGAYVVSNTGTYVGGAVEGSADVVISDVKLYDSKNKEIAATTGEGAEAVKNWSVNADKTEITLFPSNVIAGQKLTLKMFRQVEQEEKEVAVYKLAVSANLDAAKVKVADIKQATDTFDEYPVTVNAGAEVGKIMADMTADDLDKDIVKSAEVADGKLKVTTGFKAGETKITLYTLKDVNAADAAANRTVIKTVKVTTTALIDKDATKAPVVKAVNSSDVSITLSLDAKALKLKDAEVGDIYYEIKATANGEIPKNAAGAEKLKREVIKYEKKIGDQQNTTLWFDVADIGTKEAYGTGGYCKYDVAVRLVHLKDKTDKSAQTTLIADADLAVAEKSYSDSYTTGTKPFETKEPYYEDNLKLKKGASTIYTGQTAVVATPQFGKNTSYMVVDENYCRDTTKGLSYDGALDIDVDPDTNAVSVTATRSTALGKHTIEVVAISTLEGDAGVPTMYASRATVTVTVVRGIQSLSVSVPSDKLYKDPSPKKAATMTPSVTYNSEAKTKKVKWALLNSENKVLSANGKLTIANNGKVTVAKDYVVSRNESDNQFKIAAIADDFNRNVDLTPGATVTPATGKVAVSRLITITNDAMTIDSLAIINPKTNAVIARDGDTLEASQANGAKLVAFIPGAPVKAVYTSGDLAKYAAQATNVKFTSGNKAISISTSGIITVSKPAKNVVLTAAPGDGNTDKNAKKSMKLTVNYNTTGELGLQITRVDGNEYEALDIFKPDNKTPEFTDSTVAKFFLYVMEKDSEGKWDYVADTDFTNYKITVSGGKLLYNSAEELPMVTTASAVTKITLTNNNVKPAVKTEYVLTNKGISTLAKGTKAPKVTLIKGMDTLRAGEYNNSQTIGVKLTNTAKPEQAGYIADFSKLYVKVDFDWTSLNAKNPGLQYSFADQMNPKGYAKVNRDGSFYLYFGDGYTDLTAGSYKIKINFGEIDEDGCFKSVAPAAAATIKVVKPKALSFKPVTSYKISATDNGYAVLTGKGNYDYLAFEYLQNANIKGKENKFSRYFALDYTENGDHVIRLTSNYYTDVNDPNIKLDFSDKKFKDDLTGYLTYYICDMSGEEIENTVKITMSVTAPTATITKYAVSTSGVVGTAAGSKVTVQVTDNKKNPVTIAGMNYGDGNVWEGVFYEGSNVMEFTAKAALTQPKYDITITFLPADSYYVEEYDKIKSDATKGKEFIQKYGITLTAKVTAKDLATVNKGRIKVDSKNLSRTFTTYNFDGTNYVVYVPYDEVYTGTVINKITNNSVAVGTGDSAPQLIKIERYETYNYFKVTMSKALLEQAIKADVKADGKAKGTFYDAKGKAKTLNVKADVCYDAAGTQKDTFTFKLTMPANRSAYTDQGADGLSSYEQAIDYLNKNKAAIADKVDWVGDLDEEDISYRLYWAIIDAVGRDSGIDFNIYDTIDEMFEVDTANRVDPSSTENGSLRIIAKLKSCDASPKTEIIEFVLTAPKTEPSPSDVSDEVDSFISTNAAKYAVNTVTQAEILKDLRDHMKTWAAEQGIDLTPIRFRIEDFEVEQAGFDESGAHVGTVTGTVVIWNIHYTGEYAYEYGPVESEISYTIDAPVAKDEVIDTVKSALGIATVDGNTNDAGIIAQLVIANTEEGVKEDVLAVAQKAAGFAYKVEYKKDNNADAFKFKAVGAEDGEISFTLLVKDENGEYIGTKDAEDKITPIEIVLTVTPITANADIMTVAEAEAAVIAWVNKVTGDTATDEEKADLTSATASDIAAKIKTAAKLKKDTTLTVTVEDFENKPATYDTDGCVKGTVVLSKGGNTNKKEAKVPFALKVPMTGEWTLANAAAKVQAAVADANIYISNTNVKTDAGKAAIAAEILAVAKKAVPEAKFTVAIKQTGTGSDAADVKLTVKNAAAGTAGEVSLVLVITKVPAAGAEVTADDSTEVTVKHAIPALPEGSGTVDTVTADAIAEDIAKINTAAVEATDVTGEAGSEQIAETTAKAAIEAVIQDGDYAWKTEAYSLTVISVTDITAPTENDNGSATVTFTVTKDGKTSESKTLTLVINKADA